MSKIPWTRPARREPFMPLPERPVFEAEVCRTCLGEGKLFKTQPGGGKPYIEMDCWTCVGLGIVPEGIRASDTGFQKPPSLQQKVGVPDGTQTNGR